MCVVLVLVLVLGGQLGGWSSSYLACSPAPVTP